MYTNAHEALKALLPFATDKNSNLWDAGLLSISKNADEEYDVTLIGFYFESEEGKNSGSSFEKEMDISIDPVHKDVYEYLQAHFAETNPKVKWDTLVLEVRGDGSYTPHYEWEGEEVSPDAPPAPDTLTAEYLCENLQNCLSHNAPDNYEWVWEVLERSKTAEGKTSIGGKFYYSLNKDQSDAKPLEPGEYIYMYNVSEQLFDDFFTDKTANWSRIALAFTRDRKVYCKVLKADF